jgi:S-DNA-T family DNA segregation ATPase FtsK/SpoIIIE
MTATTASLQQKILGGLRAAGRSAVLGDLSFLLTGGCAAYLALALAGFHPSDPGYFSASWPPSYEAANPAGTVGAAIAQMLIFFLGGGAILVPVMVAFSSWTSWKNRQLPTPAAASWNPSANIGFGLLIIVTSVAMAASFGDIAWRGMPIPAGGFAGSTITGSARAALGPAGIWLACLVLGLAGSSLIAGKDFPFAAARNLLAKLQRKSQNPSTSGSNLSIPDTRPVEARVIEESFSVTDDMDHDRDESNEPVIEETQFLAEESEDLHDPYENGDAAARMASPPSRPLPYHTPSLDIFQSAAKNNGQSFAPTQKDIDQTAALLVKTFADFGVSGKVIGYQPGPVVTVFEFQPDAGVKQARILGLIDDLALALKVDSIFINPVPGKRALGVQVPNTRRETVYLGDLINSESFRNQASPLVFAMGKSLSGNPVCADLTSMPHLLMAGATGAGKSVAINSLICSIVMKASPEDVRMILVDPKMLELSVYEGIPHLLMPVITEPDRASHALKWAAAEMERRYKLMQFASVRNIAGFNAFWDQASESRRQELRLASGTENSGRLPYILLVIDELADLMLTAPKDVESSIQRLAQKARASGIHMVLATQRPSVDIITGVIKANLPCRLSFQVVSKHDSRTILDQVGAEKLLGRGDMLFQRPGSGRLERIQGALVSDEEVLSLVANLKSAGHAAYDDSIMGWIDAELQRERLGDEGPASDDIDSEEDPKYGDALQIARSHGVVSASFLQRHLKIGYNRAARMVEYMEKCGLVAKADGAKPRRWLGPSA